METVDQPVVLHFVFPVDVSLLDPVFAAGGRGDDFYHQAGRSIDAKYAPAGGGMLVFTLSMFSLICAQLPGYLFVVARTIPYIT